MQDNSAYHAFVMGRCSEVVTTRLTRNQLYRKVPWVRIPPSPPRKSLPLAARLVGFLFSVIFLSNIMQKFAILELHLPKVVVFWYNSANVFLFEGAIIDEDYRCVKSR